MTLYRLSIERPVLATVMSLVIIVFGLVSFQQLGVREFTWRPLPTMSATVFRGLRGTCRRTRIRPRSPRRTRTISPSVSCRSIAPNGICWS
jgi:hypothetical protein